MGVLKAKEKIVDIEINGNEVSLKMKLDDTGAAFFVEDVGEEDEDKWNIALATSPMPSKSAPVASFGGRSLKLAPQRLNFNEELNHELELKCNLTDDGGLRDDITKPTEETDSLRKGKLNKKKRRRRNQLKHSRKGSKSSLREEASEEITAKHETVVTVEPPADDSGHLDTDPLATEDGRKFRKSLRLTSEQIEELKLEAGMNEVQFSVTTAFQVIVFQT